MSSSSGLDVRIPIGGLFTALGLLLSLYGLATAGDVAHYARSVSVNINLWWGVVMLAFGLLLLLATWLGRRDTADRTTIPTAEDRPRG